MERKDYTREDNYIRAKKKVEAIKGFYWHLVVFLGVNGFITISHVIRNMANGESFMEAFWDMPTFFTWVPWGVGLVIHGIVVFDVFSFVIGKGWEERKIKEMMEKEEKDYRSLGR